MYTIFLMQKMQNVDYIDIYFNMMFLARSVI